MMNQKSRISVFMNSNPRISGMICMLIGIAAFYYSLVEPILNKTPGHTIYIHEKGILGGATIFVLGIAPFLFGKNAINVRSESPFWAKIILFLVCVAICMIFIFLIPTLKSYLQSMGYTFLR